MSRLSSSAALNEQLLASIVEVDFSREANAVKAKTILVKDCSSKRFASAPEGAIEIRGTIIVSF